MKPELKFLSEFLMLLSEFLVLLSEVLTLFSELTTLSEIFCTPRPERTKQWQKNLNT